jgi:putative FmdB family regulatory protein
MENRINNLDRLGDSALPLYEYQCKQCHSLTERIQKFSDPPLTVCPHCGGEMEQLISAAAVRFKGSGWYVTDYAKKPSKGNSSNGNGAGSSSPAESKGEASKSAGSSTSEKATSEKSSSASGKSADKP